MTKIAWMEHPTYVDQVALRSAHDAKAAAYWEAVREGSTLAFLKYEEKTSQYDRVLARVQNHLRREDARRKK